jgi:DNA ligase 1
MLNQPLKPMLLHKADKPPVGNYIHQVKFDGFRCLLHYDSGNIQLFTRHQNNCTKQFPEIKPVLKANTAILDGEMIVLDDNAKPCFESVMKRFQTISQFNIDHLAVTLPAHFVAFDIIYLNGKDLTKLPLAQRLELLEQIVVSSNSISVCPTSMDGQALFDSVKRLGLGGCCSKALDSTYQLDTRSSDWLKVKNYLYETVTITGIRKKEFGWSIAKDGKYLGVMEFVPPAERKAFYHISKQIIVDENENWRWVQPLVKCKVKFQCYTKSGLMRSPSFVEFVFDSSA